MAIKAQMQATIAAIQYYLPEQALTNDDLAADFPDWPAAKIEEKTGIRERRIARSDECASDLAIHAAKRLFASGACKPEEIDYLLLCTQSPDYFLPTTACTLQPLLGLSQGCGALDFNLGCSGFVYGLGLAKGLIETGQARNVLLITAETYSKFINPRDKSVRTIFGDAAAATLIRATGGFGPDSDPLIGPFVFGTDGTGAANLIVPAGGLRQRPSSETAHEVPAESGNWRSPENLYMNGAEIFAFTLKVVPRTVQKLLDRSGKTLSDIEFFIFHQANEYMLSHLRQKLGIPSDKFYQDMRSCGNTVSSTIPIALREAALTGQLRRGATVMLVGFGVGYSWAAALVRWGTLDA
jgi:3-oxoacyl-[acyl-carrier-protein] synthase-3